MKKLLSKGNTKLKKDNILSFGLPAGTTCPGAGECKQFCYACKGNYKRFKSIGVAQQARLQSTKQDNFVSNMIQEIRSMRNKPFAIRIHDSGDFYNQSYLNKWIEIAKQVPEVIFYAYTKSLHLDFTMRPSNMYIIASKDGIFDYKIDYLRKYEVINTYATVVHPNTCFSTGIDCSSSDVLAIQAAIKGWPILLIKH